MQFFPMIVTFSPLPNELRCGECNTYSEDGRMKAQDDKSCIAKMRKELQLDPRSSVRCPPKRSIQSGEGLV